MPVTVRNFLRAESDLCCSGASFGTFGQTRDMVPIDAQKVVGMNRDTLYSSAVFDLEAAPVTITLPDPGKRFMSLQVISQDHYAIDVVYPPGGSSLRSNTATMFARLEVRQDRDGVVRLQRRFEVTSAPEGQFALIVRAYVPTDAMLDVTYTFPTFSARADPTDIDMRAVIASLGQNIKGDAGLKSGSQAPPGAYFVVPMWFYNADKLKDRDGNELSEALSGSLNASVLSVAFTLVTTKKLFGAHNGPQPSRGGFSVACARWKRRRCTHRHCADTRSRRFRAHDSAGRRCAKRRSFPAGG